MNLLEVKNLQVHFPVKPALFGQSQGWIKAVNGVDFELRPGETVGLVGESGSGKTTVGRAILRLTTPTAGSITFRGQDIFSLSGASLKKYRRQVGIVFQDPSSSLDPRLTVEEIVAEPLQIHSSPGVPAARLAKVRELVGQVGLDPSALTRYPHEFSGGQRQRIVIARALALDPELLVCDEPVSALDVSVQAQIVNLLQDLQQARGIALLFIAHDLAVVEHISHRVMVMYQGRIVESAEAKTLIRSPQHPYTKSLIAAVPGMTPMEAGGW